MYQLNNVPNNIIELSHSKLSDNAVLSIARRIAMFKNNDALEPTHHICSLIAEASVRLTAVTDVTTAVSSIRIQLTLHVLNTRMILGLSVLLPDTNTISYVLSSNRAVWAITSHAFNASIVFVTSRTCRVFKKISTNPTIWLITVSNVANSIPIIAITTRLLGQNLHLIIVGNGIKRAAAYRCISHTNAVAINKSSISNRKPTIKCSMPIPCEPVKYSAVLPAIL